LLKFKGLPQFTWINEIVAEIKTKLKLEMNGDHPEIMSFESNDDYEGLIHITDLFNAIINKRVLNIKYKPFSSPVAKELEFHPYYLKQFNSRWFVLGHNPVVTKYKYENLALDRILKNGISESKKLYKDHEEDWQDYFSDFIGVSREKGKPEQIKIVIVDEEQANYIRTKPIHQTQNQNFKKVEGGYETSIKVIPNYELYKLLLSYGERIKVVSPENVREEMRRRILEMKNLY
jgi:predicted DNA-binding transcriptional regulator YafY